VAPYPSANLLFVTPCIYLWISSPPILVPNPSEVQAIFKVPLRSVLSLPASSTGRPRVDDEDLVDHSYEDLAWILGTPYRLHILENTSFPSSISGLTAEILIDIAMLGFGVDAPGFERSAPGQMTTAEMVRCVLDGRVEVDSARRKSRTQADRK
jgi:peroxisomal coenzyme A diphosphatase NUDT7